MKTVTITTSVVACTSLRDGEVTLRISLRTSPRNTPNFWNVPNVCAPTPPCSTSAAIALVPTFLLLYQLCVSLATSLLYFRFQRAELAGAEGFEPPSSVLETDSLAVEL